MTFRDWFNDLEAASEPPTLVSILVFAAVFLPAIFLVGLAGPVLEQVRYVVGELSSEMKAAALTVFILGTMALVRIFSLVFRRQR